jgi:predicted transcriptional regulator
MMGRQKAEPTPKQTALNDWQVEEIKKGLADADRRDFATDADMKRTVEKWTHLVR